MLILGKTGDKDTFACLPALVQLEMQSVAFLSVSNHVTVAQTHNHLQLSQAAALQSPYLAVTQYQD